MLISGLPLDEFERITHQVGDALYNANLTVHQDARELSPTRCQARVAVHDRDGAGTRTTWQGRHGLYVCWHVYRDVLAEVFERYPGAVIYTRMAPYRGRAGFARHYPRTGSANVGSMVQPVTMPQLCGCTHRPTVDMTGWAELPLPAHRHRTQRGAARCPDCNPENIHEGPLAERHAPDYAETLTHINDVLDGMEPWEREITAEQYRKDNL
jgi:hypothetical protein